jgi:hypothetical protein
LLLSSFSSWGCRRLVESTWKWTENTHTHTEHRRKYSTAHPHLTATQTNSTLARAGMRRGQQRGNVKDFHGWKNVDATHFLNRSLPYLSKTPFPAF